MIELAVTPGAIGLAEYVRTKRLPGRMFSTAVGMSLTASRAAASSGFSAASTLMFLAVLTGSVTIRRTRSGTIDDTRKLPRWGVAMNTTRFTYGIGLKNIASLTNSSASGGPLT